MGIARRSGKIEKSANYNDISARITQRVTCEWS
jgi:hypothetical protein